MKSTAEALDIQKSAMEMRRTVSGAMKQAEKKFRKRVDDDNPRQTTLFNQQTHATLGTLLHVLITRVLHPKLDYSTHFMNDLATTSNKEHVSRLVILSHLLKY